MTSNYLVEMRYSPAAVPSAYPVRVSTRPRSGPAHSRSLRLSAASLPITQLSTLNTQRSPGTPPATPGQAEQREYQFRGVIGDDEIGQPSDIVQATYTPRTRESQPTTVSNDKFKSNPER